LGIGTSGILGLDVTPEQYGAKGDAKTFGNGAMDNNSTANLTDTTNHPFVLGDVGKLICVDKSLSTTVTDQAGTRHVQTCGTISSYTSSSVVVLSFNNTSGGAISSIVYAYATDDTTAVNNAETAACNAGGGTVWLAHNYGMSATFTECTSATVNLTGISMRPPPQSNISAPLAGDSGVLWWLTKSLSGNAFLISGSSGTTIFTSQPVISNVAFVAGVGNSYDGGSTTSNGIAILNWNDLELHNVRSQGWGAAGLYMDVIGNSIATDNIATVDFENVVLNANQTGWVIGSSTTKAFNGFIQNIHWRHGDIGLNFKDGTDLIYGNLYSITWDGASLWQGDVEGGVAGGGIGHIVSTYGSCRGCKIDGDYFEQDYAGEASSINWNPTAGTLEAPAITNNSFFCSNSSTTPLILGNAGQAALGALVTHNRFNNNCGSTPIVNTKVQSTLEMANLCNTNGFGCDAIDYFGSAGAIQLGVTNAGNFIIGGNAIHTIFSGYAPASGAFELDGTNTNPPRFVAVQTAITTANAALAGIDVANTQASDAEKRNIEIGAESASTQTTHASADMYFATNNAGTFATNLILSSTGGLLLGAGINPSSFTDPGASNLTVVGTVNAKEHTGTTSGVSVSGGGTLSTGSNSFAGRITGLAATSNILTPGFTCPNAVTATFQDDTTAGGVLVTAQNATTVTFSATASDTADYIVSCR
jgi:hypothetical protein